MSAARQTRPAGAPSSFISGVLHRIPGFDIAPSAKTRIQPLWISLDFFLSIRKPASPARVFAMIHFRIYDDRSGI
jgi:hypothetical protein